MDPLAGTRQQLTRAASGHAVAAPPSTVMNSRRRTSSTGLRPRFGPAAPAMTTSRPTARAVDLLHSQSTTEVGRNPWDCPELI
jgi:hypothetical protein